MYFQDKCFTKKPNTELLYNSSTKPTDSLYIIIPLLRKFDILALAQLCWFLFCFSYDIEITDEIVGRAPIPELIVGVKQSGNS